MIARRRAPGVRRPTILDAMLLRSISPRSLRLSGVGLSSLLLPVCAVLSLPVLGVALTWLQFDAAAAGDLLHEWQTVMPRHALTSLILGAGVAVGVGLLGAVTAAAVCLFEFRGRRLLEAALLLPMAMPAYVLAYAATDALQFSGPLQTALRAAWAWEGPLWPDVRSLPGAIAMFTLCLYPYVYLLTRAALLERGAALMESARLLGAGLPRRLREVALPLARPAIVAGVALAVMETLADVGVGSYFGLSTFTTGIYKAWLVLDDRAAAARLAAMLLLVVAVVLTLEQRARRRLRFVSTRTARGGAEARPIPLRGVSALAAQLLCATPVLLGFVLPVAWLLHLAASHDLLAALDAGLAGRFVGWALTSVALAAAAALLAAALALALGQAARGDARGGLQRSLTIGHRLVAWGYAVPGMVIAIGILGLAERLQAHWPAIDLSSWLTGTVLGVLYAYLVRFTAVADQTVAAGYSRIPPHIDETARMLGAGPRRRFVELHLPLLGRSLGVASLLVFVDVMKELPATLVLRPFDTDTLAVTAYQLARDERLAEAALPSLAIVAVGLIPVLILSRALRRTLGG